MTYLRLIRDFYWHPIRDVYHLAVYHRSGPCWRCVLDRRLDSLARTGSYR